jgi:7-cyano-7-deazaguanine synthase in queuosine biosynthesis
MTRVIERTALTQPKPSGALLLDWLPRNPAASTIQGPVALTDGASSLPSLDLLRIAAGVFCADKLIPRSTTSDGWTRDIELTVPVSNPDLWASAQPLTDAVEYLTGDRWTFKFGLGGHPVAQPRQPEVDAVTLFSGGLDSLTGAIDMLTAEPDLRLGLVSHHEGNGITPRVQRDLITRLRGHFDQRIVEYPAFIRPAPARPEQQRPVGRARERTTRGRSLLFIAAGMAVASSHGENVPLAIPENGFIGINVPLTRARVGSFSTRTTHPYFLDRLAALFDTVQLENRLTNPYRHMTKGEMLAASKNPGVLADLAPLSVSCAHPEAGRWAQVPQGNCGYCYPCLIRRAALHSIGRDVTAEYSFDALTDPMMWTRSQRGKDVRALVAAVRRGVQPIDVLRNGPVPGDPTVFAEVAARGLAEIRTLFVAKGDGPVSDV